MSYIKREAEQLLHKFATSKSVTITGARQVGKTTLTTLFLSAVRLQDTYWTCVPVDEWLK